MQGFFWYNEMFGNKTDMMATQHTFNKHTKCHLIVQLKRGHISYPRYERAKWGFWAHTQAVWQEILCYILVDILPSSVPLFDLYWNVFYIFRILMFFV